MLGKAVVIDSVKALENLELGEDIGKGKGGGRGDGWRLGGGLSGLDVL